MKAIWGNTTLFPFRVHNGVKTLIKSHLNSTLNRYPNKQPYTIKNFIQYSFKNEWTLGVLCFFLHPNFQFSYTLTYARSKSCCINWGKTVRFARKCQEKCTMVFIEINWLHFSHLTLNCQNKCTNLWRCHVMSVLSSQVSNAMYVQGESYWS